MNKKIMTRTMSVIIFILIIQVYFMPAIAGQSNKISKQHFLEEKKAVIELYSCFVDHVVEKKIKTMSTGKAISLTTKLMSEDIKNITYNAFNEKFYEKLSLLKEYNLLPKTTYFGNMAIKNTEEKIQLPDRFNFPLEKMQNGNIMQNENIINVGGLLTFFGVGLGVVFGLHGIRGGLGTSMIGLYTLRGVTYTKGGFFGGTDGRSVDGLIKGLVIGFIGYFVRILIPNFAGLFLFGCGWAMYTSWSMA